MNQVLTQYRSVSIHSERPHIVLHAERRPFDDAQNYEANGERLFATLKRHNKVKGDFSQFVGFLCGQKHTYICLPKVFRYTFEDIGQSFSIEDQCVNKYLDLARLLRQVFSKYRQAHKDSNSVRLLEAFLPDQSQAQISEPASHLMIADLILKDYRRAGLWIDSDKHLVKAQRGKVNWKRTIQKGGELWVGQNKSRRPIYTDPLVNRSYARFDHPITLAQITVLREIDLLYRPLLTDHPVTLPQMSIELRSTHNHGYLVKQLERSLSSVFQARPRRLASLLLKYLKISEYNGKRNQVDLLGTTSFHSIYERMCYQTLSGQQPKLALSTDRAVWNISVLPESIRKEKKLREGNPQQIDLIAQVTEHDSATSHEPHLIHYTLPKSGSDKLLILDAKYYDFIGAVSHSDGIAYLPKLDDIRKQYGYQAWLESTMIDKEIVGNAFLFPTYGMEEELKPNTHEVNGYLIPFQRLGEVSLQGRTEPGQTDDQRSKSLRRPLYLLGIPLDQLMMAYVYGISVKGNDDEMTRHSGFTELFLGSVLNSQEKKNLP